MGSSGVGNLDKLKNDIRRGDYTILDFKASYNFKKNALDFKIFLVNLWIQNYYIIVITNYNYCHLDHARIPSLDHMSFEKKKMLSKTLSKKEEKNIEIRLIKKNDWQIWQIV